MKNLVVGLFAFVSLTINAQESSFESVFENFDFKEIDLSSLDNIEELDDIKSLIPEILKPFKNLISIETEDLEKVGFDPKTRVYKEATFSGGNAVMKNWIQKNINYPENSMKNNEQGKVVVNFTISKYGKVTNVNVIEGVNSEIDSEAIRVVESMHTWSPCIKDGKAFSSEFTLPIIFKIK